MAAPGSLTFGTVGVASNSTRTVTLTNSGITVVSISHISVNGKGFSISTVATPLKLAAGQSINLEPHFAPATAGAATGSIAITSNASDPNLTIALSGTGVQGRLSATPASTSFGNVAMGGDNSKTLTLRNYGLGSATISHLSVSGKGFSISTVATPLKLAAGQSINLEGSLRPCDRRSSHGKYRDHQQCFGPRLTIALSGTGVQGRLGDTRKRQLRQCRHGKQ